MVSDSVTDSSLFSGSPYSNDFDKKKGANCSSKTRQWKLDARRRQWICHLVNKGQVGEEENGGTKSLTEKRMDSPFDHLLIGSNYEEIDGAFSEWNIESDADSSAVSSPTSVLTSKDPSSKTSDCFCCSEKMGEEDEEVYGDALDNFEVFTDALSDFENDSKSPSPETMNEEEESPRMRQSNSNPDKAIRCEKSPLLETKKSEQEPSKTRPTKRSPKKRPKKSEEGASSPMRMSSTEPLPCPVRMSSTEPLPCPVRMSSTEPLPCPICCEEMDATDLSFSACPCGFNLCLFCYREIIDNDGRCPNCRKQYEKNNVSGEVSFLQRGRETLRLSPSFRGLDRA